MENKKAVNETPVEEPKSCGQRLPQRGRDFINGSTCCGFHTLQFACILHMYQQVSTGVKGSFGWHGWDRTSDRRINSALLYRLSYMPMCSFNFVW